MRCRINFSHLQRKADIFINIHVGIEAIGLEHHGDVSVLWFQTIHDLSVDLHLTAGDLFKAGNHPHCRCLAAAGRAQQDKEFLIGDFKIKIINTDEVAPPFRQIFQSYTSHFRPPIP